MDFIYGTLKGKLPELAQVANLRQFGNSDQRSLCVPGERGMGPDPDIKLSMPDTAQISLPQYGAPDRIFLVFHLKKVLYCDPFSKVQHLFSGK